MVPFSASMANMPQAEGIAPQSNLGQVRCTQLRQEQTGPFLNESTSLLHLSFNESTQKSADSAKLQISKSSSFLQECQSSHTFQFCGAFSMPKSALWQHCLLCSTRCSHLCPNASQVWHHQVHRRCQLQQPAAPVAVCPRQFVMLIGNQQAVPFKTGTVLCWNWFKSISTNSSKRLASNEQTVSQKLHACCDSAPYSPHKSWLLVSPGVVLFHSVSKELFSI